MTITFDPNVPILPHRVNPAISELVTLAVRLEDVSEGSISRSSFEHVLEIESAYKGPLIGSRNWTLQDIFSPALMDIARLTEEIRKKERLAATYQGCDQNWLLFIVDGMDAAQDQEIRLDNWHVESAVFDRIIVFKPLWRHISHVWCRS